MDIIGKFGNQDHIASSRHAGIQCNPPGFVSHYLYHHHPFVRTGSGVKPVYGIRSDADGRVKAEGEISPPNIIIDGLGNGNDVQSSGSQFCSGFLRTVTANAHNTVQPQFFDVLLYQSRFIHIGHHSMLLERLFAGGSQHCTAQVQQSRQGLIRKRLHIFCQ